MDLRRLDIENPLRAGGRRPARLLEHEAQRRALVEQPQLAFRMPASAPV
jgi:hypothetical protein